MSSGQNTVGSLWDQAASNDYHKISKRNPMRFRSMETRCRETALALTDRTDIVLQVGTRQHPLDGKRLALLVMRAGVAYQSDKQDESLRWPAHDWGCFVSFLHYVIQYGCRTHPLKVAPSSYQVLCKYGRQH